MIIKVISRKLKSFLQQSVEANLDETSSIPHFLDNRSTAGGEIILMSASPFVPLRFLIPLSYCYISKGLCRALASLSLS
jgi:hypothetical protein